MTKNITTFTIFLPFLLLLLCVKGDFGNFDDIPPIKQVQQDHERYEFSGHPFEFSRTRSLYLTTLSIAKEADFDLNSNLEMFARGDTGYVMGKSFSWAPPGTAIVGSFFFLLSQQVGLGQFGTYLSIVIVSTLVHFLIYKLMIRFLTKDTKTALLAAYIYTFATIAFTYSITYFQHQYTSLFVIAMLYGIYTVKRNPELYGKWAYAIPTIYGASVFFDYPNIIILLPLLLAWVLLGLELKGVAVKIVLRRSFLMISLFISLLMMFNHFNFGKITQMSNTLVSIREIGMYEIESRMEFKNNIFNIFHAQKTLDGIKMYLTDPKRGLFFFCPILLTGILYAHKLVRTRKRFALLSIIVIAANILIYASFAYPSGGWCFGPRYLLPTILLLSIPTALWIKRASARMILMISPLLLLSILNNLAGALSTLTIPENMETTYYGIKNLEFVLNNVSGSIVYNTFASSIPLWTYMCAIATLIIFIFYFLIKPDSKSNHE